VVTASVPYDYSQPVVVNNYVTSDATAEGADASSSQVVQESDEGLSYFDEGLAEFKAGSYQRALTNFDTALRELPNDPVVHEVRALTLFALGDYTQAAASLNSLLSSAPGMDWTTMSALYGDNDDYSTQLQNLENFCRSHGTDAAAFFVLAHHYLVIDSKENAIKALEVVVANEPQDVTAKRMLDALKPPPAESPNAAVANDSAQSTDLVGKWQASVGSSKIELTITDDSQFIWTATESGQPPVELRGDLTADADAIVLASQSQGSMAGIVKSQGADNWQFLLEGAPANDPGLSFKRMGG
jgi:tetratricopeptide (TPR) repeat protein